MTATPRSLARSLASRTGRGLGEGETLALRGRSSSEAEAEAASRVSPFSRLAFPAFFCVSFASIYTSCRVCVWDRHRKRFGICMDERAKLFYNDI
jgi:hypothetical protein